jgi:uncharacterized protein (TIGR02145 family)
LSSTDQPGNGLFITTSTSPNDWRNPQNTNLWQGVNGINNPCPLGFKVPSQAEWSAENSNSIGVLNLSSAGGRLNGDGMLDSEGSTGNYWTSTVDATKSHRYGVSQSPLFMSLDRSYGFSVRCIKE